MLSGSLKTVMAVYILRLQMEEKPCGYGGQLLIY
jgi:hypothetical protein